MSYFGLDKNDKDKDNKDKENLDDGRDKADNKDPKDDKKKEKNAKDDEQDNLVEYDKGQEHEKMIEEKIGDPDGKRLENTLIKRIEFDMSEAKKQVKLKLEDKIQMEMMRRWYVKIYNIYITPLRDMLDPFVQFTIGGDYSIAVYSNKKGDTYKIPKGSRGFSDKTEVIPNVDKLMKMPFDKTIELEMRMSYSMVNSQKLMVEVWDYNTVWMNSIKGYTLKPLIDIVNGNVNVTMDISKKEPKKKNPGIIYFQI